MKAACGTLAVALVVFAGCGGGSDRSTARSQPHAQKPALMTVGLGAREHGGLGYRRSLRVKPGTTVDFNASLFNTGGKQARHVRVKLSAPGELHLVGASELLKPVTVQAANADPLPGDLRSGIALGPYPSRGASDLLFQMTVPKGAPAGRHVVRLTVSGIGFADTGTTTVQIA
jgi:hypothetical protein